MPSTTKTNLILNYLEQAGSCNSVQIAAALDLPQSTTRNHLAQLLCERRVFRFGGGTSSDPYRWSTKTPVDAGTNGTAASPYDQETDAGPTSLRDLFVEMGLIQAEPGPTPNRGVLATIHEDGTVRMSWDSFLGLASLAGAGVH
jgi:hypothetical protein